MLPLLLDRSRGNDFFNALYKAFGSVMTGMSGTSSAAAKDYRKPLQQFRFFTLGRSINF